METLLNLRVKENQALEPGGTALATSGAMKHPDTARILALLTELSESINGLRPTEAGPKVRIPLSDRVDELDRKVDKLDTRVSEVQLGLATLAANTKVQFKEVNRNMTVLRVEFVGHMERIHSELTGRIVDLETPGTQGSGGSGMPLAS